MKTLLIVMLIVASVIAVLFAVAAVMNYLLWKQETQKNQTAMYNWNCFIIDNLDNPKLKDLLKRRNELLLNCGPKK